MSTINITEVVANYVNVESGGKRCSFSNKTTNKTYKPKQFVKAYGLDEIKTPNNSLLGTGVIVGVIIPYAYPNLQSDFNTFCTANKLPQQTINVTNLTAIANPTIPVDSQTTIDGFNEECAADIQIIHTMAPGATIIVVTSSTSNLADLQTAIQYAVTTKGANIISMSWGIGLTYDQYTLFTDFNTKYTNFASVFNNSSVSYIAASGDLTNVPQFPSTCANVISIGGTTLYLKSDSRRKCEIPWTSVTTTTTTPPITSTTNYTIGSGCGYSPYNPQPSYQTNISTIPLAYRAVPDVVMAGDPSTGFPIYFTVTGASSGNFIYFGGTSLSTALFSGVIAIANQLRIAANKQCLTTVEGAATGQLQRYLYHVIYFGNAQTPYKSCKPYCGNFYDINKGNCGAYYAGKGYDMASGLGSPNANILVQSLLNA